MTQKKQRLAEVQQKLERMYPKAVCSLDYKSPFQLLIATILSAQSTDVRVNMVTPALFRKYPDPAALAAAKPLELERAIHSTGFFRAKSKSLLGCAAALIEKHGGEVPRTLAELVELPGVGRKTANVVLGNAFGIDEGIVVDTHVTRVSGRLGFTRNSDAIHIELDLMKIVPRKDWTRFSHRLIFHGRAICVARKPKCSECLVNALCPSAQEDQV